MIAALQPVDSEDEPLEFKPKQDVEQSSKADLPSSLKAVSPSPQQVVPQTQQNQQVLEEFSFIEILNVVSNRKEEGLDRITLAKLKAGLKMVD